MKIGIISSWNETLALFKFLTRYDNEYLIYHDQSGFPYWEKSLDFILNRIRECWKFLKDKWAEIVIIDPVYELALHQLSEKIDFQILPLFKTYLHEYVFKYSLVGKLWILSDFWIFKDCQKIIENEQKEYLPTETQKAIKRFSFPFHFRVKSASSWKFNISDLWVHNPYLIRTLKNDLRYFKDANIDTIIPLNYHYFRMQRTIKSFFNFQKTRFHDFSVLENCFKMLTIDKKSDKYSVSIRTNQSSDFLLREKELIWLMQRWRQVKLKIEEI